MLKLFNVHATMCPMLLLLLQHNLIHAIHLLLCCKNQQTANERDGKLTAKSNENSKNLVF